MADGMVKPAQNQSKDAPVYRSAPPAPNQTNAGLLSGGLFGFLPRAVGKALAPPQHYAEGTEWVQDPIREPPAPVQPFAGAPAPAARSIPFAPGTPVAQDLQKVYGGIGNALGAAARGMHSAVAPAAAAADSYLTGAPPPAAPAPKPPVLPRSPDEATHALVSAFGGNPTLATPAGAVSGDAARSTLARQRMDAAYPMDQASGFNRPPPAAPSPSAAGQPRDIVVHSGGHDRHYGVDPVTHAITNPHEYTPEQFADVTGRVPIDALYKLHQMRLSEQGGYDPKTWLLTDLLKNTPPEKRASLVERYLQTVARPYPVDTPEN